MLEKVNPHAAANAVPEPFVYNRIGELNGNMLNVVQVENRMLDFHVHEDSDELFYVLEGEMKLETDEGVMPLKAGEMVIVPHGMRHRPIITKLVKILLMDREGTLNESNSVSPDRD